MYTCIEVCKTDFHMTMDYGTSYKADVYVLNIISS